MPKKKKLSLGDLRVDSFVTSSEELNEIKGGFTESCTHCVTFNTCHTQCDTDCLSQCGSAAPPC
jgi:hypothetical protein